MFDILCCTYWVNREHTAVYVNRPTQRQMHSNILLIQNLVYPRQVHSSIDKHMTDHSFLRWISGPILGFFLISPEAKNTVLSLKWHIESVISVFHHDKIQGYESSFFFLFSFSLVFSVFSFESDWSLGFAHALSALEDSSSSSSSKKVE